MANLKKENDDMADELTRDQVRAIALEVAQQVAQAAVQSAVNTTTATQASGTTAQERIQPEVNLGREREFEIGRDEAWSANMKRTHDEYQHESLESIRRNRTYVDKIIQDSHGYDMGARNIANQALQNAVETANMVGKQAVRHGDLSIDRQWNVDEQSFVVASILDAMNSPSVKQSMAAAVAEALLAREGKA